MTLLRLHILGLRLRPDAPFPGQVSDRASKYLRLQVIK